MAIDNVQKAKHHLEEAGQQAKTEAKTKLSDANQRLQQGTEKVKGYVKDNPLTALGIAVAIGMGISALLNRGR